MPRGIVDAQSYTFTVRRELEPRLLGRLSDLFEHRPGAIDPCQLRGYVGDGRIGQDALVGRRKARTCRVPRVRDVLCHDRRIAGGREATGIEGLRQEGILADEQEVALGENGPRVRLDPRGPSSPDRATRHIPSCRWTSPSRRRENDAHLARTMGDGAPSRAASGPVSSVASAFRRPRPPGTVGHCRPRTR